MRVTPYVIFIVCTLIENSYEPINAREFGQEEEGEEEEEEEEKEEEETFI